MSYYGSSYSYGSFRRQGPPLFIQEHEYYYTPGEMYLRRVLDNNNMRSTSTKFFQELCRFYSHQMFANEDYIDPHYHDISSFPSSQQEQLAAKKVMYEQLYPEYMPGYTPTEKALFLLQYMKDIEKKDLEQEVEKKSKEEIDTLFEDVVDRLPGRDQWENPMMNKLIENKQDLNNFKEKMDFFKKIAQIDSFGKSFEVRKKVTDIRVNNSPKTKQKRLTDFEDIVKMPLIQMLYPDFAIKLAQKSLITNTPVKPEVKKQKILIVIDDSGLLISPFNK